MRRFGVALGLAALVHLFGLWGATWWRFGMLLPVVALATILLLEVGRGRRFLLDLFHSDDAPYASWASATIIVASTAVPDARYGWLIWWVGTSLAIAFYVLGVSSAWIARHDIDLAHVAWFTPALVSALDAPSSIWPILRDVLGWLGFIGMTAVVVVSVYRVIREHDPAGMRSPWYGIGGSAVMALWGVDALPRLGAMLCFASMLMMSIFWVVAVAKHQGWGSQGAWSNLFSLCSAAAVAIRVEFMLAAAALTLCAIAAAANDLLHTVRRLPSASLLLDGPTQLSDDAL